MSLTLYEQETVISFNEESKEASIYTSSRRVAKWLAKELMPEETFTDGEEITGWRFSVPKNAVRLKPGKKQLYVGGTSR